MRLAPWVTWAALTAACPARADDGPQPPPVTWLSTEPRDGDGGTVRRIAEALRTRLPRCAEVVVVVPGDDDPPLGTVPGTLATALAGTPETDGACGGARAGTVSTVPAEAVGEAVWQVAPAVRGPRLELTVRRRPWPPPALALPFAPILTTTPPVTVTTYLAPLDAELRSRMAQPGPPRTARSLVARASPRLDVGAPVVAVGAVTRGVLVLVTAREVLTLEVGRDLRGRPVAEVTSRLALPPRAPVGAPRPFGAVAPSPPGGEPNEVTVSVAGRRPASLRLGPRRVGRALTPRDPTSPACEGAGDATAGAAFERVPTPGGGCARRIAPGDRLEARPWPGVFFARAARRLRTVDGGTITFEAASTDRGAIVARVDGREVAALRYGAALGLADLEGDGTAEILTSGPGAGAPDRLHVLRLRRDGALVAVWTSAPLAGSAFVATGGDVDADGADELIAVEELTPGTVRLWVIR